MWLTVNRGGKQSGTRQCILREFIEEQQGSKWNWSTPEMAYHVEWGYSQQWLTRTVTWKPGQNEDFSVGDR